MSETNTSEKMSFDAKDIQDNKVIAALAYIVFFLPLIAAKDSKFGKEHAKQGLVLLIASLIIWVAGMVIPVIGWFIIGPLGSILILVIAIIAIIKTLQGEFWEIPYIGKYRHSFKF
ncbi:MAG: DUF4870 domain-containing protein [Patescibacteria group bacterium]|nr:DUF4870 domain-containing protein [Patescibacteria group bacterium]